MAGSPLKNLRFFDELCGEDFNNIVLTTTMWNDVEEEVGKKREEELKSEFWRTMLGRGASIRRFFNTRESAFDILTPIFEEVNKRSALLLQKEMNDLNLQLKETSAGKTLYLALEDLLKRQQTTLSKIRSELKEPNLDDDELKLLMDEYQNLDGQLQRAREDLQKMKISIGERILQIARSIDWTRLFRSVLTTFLFVILTKITHSIFLSRKRRQKLMDDRKEDDVPPTKEVVNEEEPYDQERGKDMNAEEGTRKARPGPQGPTPEHDSKHVSAVELNTYGHVGSS